MYIIVHCIHVRAGGVQCTDCCDRLYNCIQFKLYIYNTMLHNNKKFVHIILYMYMYSIRLHVY